MWLSKADHSSESVINKANEPMVIQEFSRKPYQTMPKFDLVTPRALKHISAQLFYKRQVFAHSDT